MVGGFAAARERIERLDGQGVGDSLQEDGHGAARARRRGVHGGLVARWPARGLWWQGQESQNLEAVTRRSADVRDRLVHSE